jgi:hypothetical protein
MNPEFVYHALYVAASRVDADYQLFGNGLLAVPFAQES